MGSSLLPTKRQGRMASPWEQSSRDKCHPPALSGVERDKGRWWQKVHHLSYHPGKHLPAEERNQCRAGAAFPPPPSLYLTNMGGEDDRREWAVSWLQALSCTPPSTRSLAPIIYLSIQVYTRAHMHAHREARAVSM